MKGFSPTLLFLLFLIRPVVAQGQFEYVTNFTSITNDGVITTSGAIAITGYTGSGGAVTIPGSINGYPVTEIGSKSFYDATNVTSATIPTNVVSIDGLAFTGSGLASITIPNSVTNLGGSSFASCLSLTNAIIGNGVEDISGAAFQSCIGLTTVTIGSGVSTIEDYAFGYCGKLTSAYFWGNPPALPSPSPDDIFYGDSYVTAYYLAGTSGWGSTYAGVNTAIWIQYAYTTNADNTIAVTQYYGAGGAVVIPGTINGLPVTSIGDETFYDYSNLTSVTIPNSVTNIGNEAFENCAGLTGIMIPTNVVTIGNDAFAGCIGLGSVNIPNSVSSIGQGAFENCAGLGSVTIPTNITTIADETFYNCTNLASLIMPNNVAYLGNGAFEDCSALVSIYFQGNAPALGSNVFNGDDAIAYYLTGTSGWGSTLGGLQAVNLGLAYTINDGAVTITGYTGSDPSVPIPATINGLPVTSIGSSAFYDNSSLVNVMIPDDVTNIGNEAFANCEGLNNITIPASVATLGDDAFQGCTNLIPVTFEGNAPSLGSDVFANDDASVFYQNGTTGWGATLGGLWTVNLNLRYATNNGAITITGWSGASGALTVPGAINRYVVSTIGQAAFEYSGSTNITLPDTITSIGNYAFTASASLTSINIPDSVTNIGQYAFDECFQLPIITIPASVISIGPDAFYDCNHLGSVIVSNNILSQSEFQQCYALTNVTLAGEITSIPGYAFTQCPLTALTIPGTVTSVGNFAFYESSLTNILIGSSVTNIGAEAFGECTHLLSVYFTGNAPVFGSGAFVGDYPATAYSIEGKTGWPAGDVRNDIVNETFPSLVITHPVNNQDVTDTPAFYIIGTAKGSVPLYGVWFQVNSNGWNAVTTTNRWTNWTATASIFVGTNLVQAYAVDHFGNSSNLLVDVIDISSFTFVTNGGTITITGYIGNGGAVNIPSTINSLPVVNIGSEAFLNANNITSVTIPNSVTNISDDAFFGGTLAGITIDSNLTNIGNDAFSNCTNLTSIYFAGNAPISSGSDLFLNDSEAVVYYLPGTAGWNSTFGGISSVEVSENVAITNPFDGESTTDGIFTVTGTATGSAPVSSVWFQINTNGWVEAVTSNNWTNWTVASSVTAASIVNGTNVVQAYSVDNFGNTSAIVTNDFVFEFNFYFRNQDGTVTITGYNSTNGSAIIPDTINGFPVTSIGNDAFNVCEVVTNVIISTNVTSIGSYAFLGAENLLSVTIPDSVTSIGIQTFGECYSLGTIYIPASVTGIGATAFEACYNLQAITVDPANPDFNSVDGVLFNKNLDTLLAFPGGNGPDYVVPGSVTNIAYGAFSECTALNSITIPPGVTELSDWSFSFCYGLKSMYFEGNPPTIGGSYAFYADSNVTCYYPPGNTQWVSSFAGFPSALWLPRMQAGSPAAAARPNQFAFDINWVSGQTVVVEAATNLFDPVWLPIWTNTLVGGSTNFSDPQWSNYPARYYRISAP